MRIIRYLIIISIIFCMAICNALATPIITVTETWTGPVGGIYTYNYILSVDESSPENAWDFWVFPTVPFTSVSQIIDTTGTEPLVLWNFDTDEESFIRWYATDELGAYDLEPGESLSGFFYESTGVVSTNYDVGGSDPLTGAPTVPYASGNVPGPIPEPGTIILVFSGLGGFVIYSKIRKKATR